MAEERVHGTYKSERDAREAAERLGQPAIVQSVRFMALVNDPLTPRTINPWCVITRQRG